MDWEQDYEGKKETGGEGVGGGLYRIKEHVSTIKCLPLD